MRDTTIVPGDPFEKAACIGGDAFASDGIGTAMNLGAMGAGQFDIGAGGIGVVEVPDPQRIESDFIHAAFFEPGAEIEAFHEVQIERGLGDADHHRHLAFRGFLQLAELGAEIAHEEVHKIGAMPRPFEKLGRTGAHLARIGVT